MVAPAPVDPRFGAAARPAAIAAIFEAQRRRQYEIGATAAPERIRKLRRLEAAVLARREEIRAALFEDYGRPGPEVDLSDIYPIVAEARHAARHLKKWMRPRRVAAPLALLGTRARIHFEPKGVVLIISPWNFPFNLTFGPLISAIAAGNCAILKPSEMTPHSANCMKRIISELFEEDEVAVIEGDATVAEALLSKPFDHFFFTGSPAVGRIVMKAAAEHLASVTLELGAKSPVIVDRTADLDEAARKIAWGKYLNSGQICIAPDYLLVDETIKEAFVSRLKTCIAEMYPDASRGHIVNAGHHQRLSRSLAQARESGAVVFSGGTSDDATSDIAPTLVENVDPDSVLLRQEIFGPLLPVVPYADLDEALSFIRERHKPLALYLFSRSREVIGRVVRGTSAGGTTINDTLVQFFHPGLPFGGAGTSGIGKSHGIFGFEAFSNARGILEQPLRRTPMQLMYPPYTKFKQKLIDFTLRYL